VQPNIVDQICLWTAIIAPIGLIICFRWIGLILGTLTVCLCFVVAGILLSALDPQREVLFLDMLWMLLGWIPALIYKCLIFGLRECIAWLLRKCKNKYAPDGQQKDLPEFEEVLRLGREFRKNYTDDTEA
jgi:uncharacterized membrane protein required for colicin V production